MIKDSSNKTLNFMLEGFPSSRTYSIDSFADMKCRWFFHSGNKEEGGKKKEKIQQKLEVLPGFEPGFAEASITIISKSTVLTTTL